MRKYRPSAFRPRLGRRKTGAGSGSRIEAVGEGDKEEGGRRHRQTDRQTDQLLRAGFYQDRRISSS